MYEIGIFMQMFNEIGRIKIYLKPSKKIKYTLHKLKGNLNIKSRALKLSIY